MTTLMVSGVGLWLIASPLLVLLLLLAAHRKGALAMTMTTPIGTWPADWTTRRQGANVAGNRYVCPTMAPNPVHEDPTLPECMAATQCDRCYRWVCEDHADDDYHECASGVFCRECGTYGCADVFCQEDG